MKTLAVFLMFLAGTWAHMCMISPPQRGSMVGINKPGADDCALVTGPCGGRMPMPHTGIALMAGENFTVTLQKNLDHYTASSPGMFTINLREGEQGEFKQLGMIKDMGEPSLSLYSTNITIPMHPMGHGMATLQAVYVTKNPQAPAMFYECADIHIMPRP
ncbi:hypothetical protein Bbelb_265010 [Branchiostoma belcheri]|nr:hypothetical protein Bbelb_265010 [Branchiostoma belcheri]